MQKTHPKGDGHQNYIKVNEEGSHTYVSWRSSSIQLHFGHHLLTFSTDFAACSIDPCTGHHTEHQAFNFVPQTSNMQTVLIHSFIVLTLYFKQMILGKCCIDQSYCNFGGCRRAQRSVLLNLRCIWQDPVKDCFKSFL